MKYTADCPECATEFEVGGPRTAANGIQCTFCGHKFTPEKISRISDDETSEVAPDDVPTKTITEEISKPKAGSQPLKDQREYDQLKTRGEAHFIFGLLCIFLSVVLMLIGFSDGNISFLEGSGGFFSIGLILIFLSQCYYIRAGLEKLFTKE